MFGWVKSTARTGSDTPKHQQLGAIIYDTVTRFQLILQILTKKKRPITSNLVNQCRIKIIHFYMRFLMLFLIPIP